MATAIDALSSVLLASFRTTPRCAAALPLRRSGQGQKVVIDRCNVTRLQRRVWLGVADENQANDAVCAAQTQRRRSADAAQKRSASRQASVACIWLDVPEAGLSLGRLRLRISSGSLGCRLHLTCWCRSRGLSRGRATGLVCSHAARSTAVSRKEGLIA